jgi:hypothetical protein
MLEMLRYLDGSVVEYQSVGQVPALEMGADGLAPLVDLPECHVHRRPPLGPVPRLLVE